MKPLSLEENEVLFGSDPTEGIVAVEPVDDDAMRVFFRRNGRVETENVPFRPFMLLSQEDLLKSFHQPLRLERLSPENEFRFLVLFESWIDCLRAKSYLQKKTGESSSSPKALYLFVSDPVSQFLMATGKTLFKGLAFEDLHRLALDIETATAEGYEFSNPAREEDRILSIALMDNRGFGEILFGREMDEKKMLEALGERISRLDPDVLEGHNIFNFDLDYIAVRARRYGVALSWGRDGSDPKVRRSRFSVAERVVDYSRWEIFGRHVVDTLFLVQYYDVTAREMESYGLKSAARHFGLAVEDRPHIEGHLMKWHYENDPEKLKAYNLEDVRETLALSELLGYPFFLQARMFPFSYQNIFVRGNATKINTLFLREYLRRRASVPRPGAGGAFEGGYTDVFVTGVVKNVVHCDVASLYPSLMLSYGLKPSGDSLNVFLPLLKDLRAFRLEAKAHAREAPSQRERDYYQALQQTFKVLINSFYGYLGTQLHNFSDPEVAAEITRRGRELIQQMIDFLKKKGAVPVEIDTDGIYFVPPPGIETAQQAEALVARLSESLPEGIDVQLDGRYPSMFSYKMKNYALLDEKGAVIVKGSALRSRGMERYLRDFLTDMLRMLLKGKSGEVSGLVEATLKRLEEHEIGIDRLAKTEALHDSLETYRQKIREKKRNPSALYELALASGRDYRAGDQISHYVTGTRKKVRVYESCKLASAYDPDHPDENVAYYRDKLLSLVEKFREFIR